jgi:hypothetical protein
LFRVPVGGIVAMGIVSREAPMATQRATVILFFAALAFAAQPALAQRGGGGGGHPGGGHPGAGHAVPRGGGGHYGGGVAQARHPGAGTGSYYHGSYGGHYGHHPYYPYYGGHYGYHYPYYGRSSFYFGLSFGWPYYYAGWWPYAYGYYPGYSAPYYSSPYYSSPYYSAPYYYGHPYASASPPPSDEGRPYDADGTCRALRPEASEGDTGRVRLEVRPDDASVYVDDEFCGNARESRFLTLPPGRHSIELVRPGFEVARREADVVKGETVDVLVELQRP